MIGFPKTPIDFSNCRSPLKKPWQNYIEDQACLYLKDQDFFSNRTQNWKYFPFQKFIKQNFVFNKASPSLVKTKAPPKDSSSLLITVKNGEPFPHFKENKNLFVGSWKQFLLGKEQLSPQIQKQIKHILIQQRNPFCSLNNALFTDGLILIIKNQLKAPLEIHYIQSDTHELQGLNLRNFIFLEPQASAQILEIFYGRTEQKPLFLNIQTDCFLNKKSRLTSIRVDKMENQDILISHLFSKLSSQAKANFFSLSLNAGISYYNKELEQNEKTASEIRGLSLIEDRKYAHHKVTVKHKEKEGISRQLYRSFLLDSAKQIFQGLVSIEQPAQKSSTNQLSKNFLLGKGALAVVHPTLDIVADNVKASHGATVSPFTEHKNRLFYLETRGIDFLEAFHLVLSSLIEEMFSDLPISTQIVLKPFWQHKLKILKERTFIDNIDGSKIF